MPGTPHPDRGPVDQSGRSPVLQTGGLGFKSRPVHRFPVHALGRAVYSARTPLGVHGRTARPPPCPLGPSHLGPPLRGDRVPARDRVLARPARARPRLPRPPRVARPDGVRDVVLLRPVLPVVGAGPGLTQSRMRPGTPSGSVFHDPAPGLMPRLPLGPMVSPMAPRK